MSGVKDFNVPFKDILANITTGLDVDVYYNELGNSYGKIHVNIYSKNFNVFSSIGYFENTVCFRKFDCVNSQYGYLLFSSPSIYHKLKLILSISPDYFL